MLQSAFRTMIAENARKMALENTKSYYSGRAEAEREMAASCHDEKITQIHLTLANHCERVANGKLPLRLRVVQESSDVWPTTEEIRSKAFQ